ncbi:hypothetical protein CF319_g4515 [Tilletia indica]|nr:hypothetical protein CF319_g4515 [Tilletia indica]
MPAHRVIPHAPNRLWGVGNIIGYRISPTTHEEEPLCDWDNSYVAYGKFSDPEQARRDVAAIKRQRRRSPPPPYSDLTPPPGQALLAPLSDPTPNLTSTPPCPTPPPLSDPPSTSPLISTSPCPTPSLLSDPPTTSPLIAASPCRTPSLLSDPPTTSPLISSLPCRPPPLLSDPAKPSATPSLPSRTLHMLPPRPKHRGKRGGSLEHQQRSKDNYKKETLILSPN